MLSTLDDPKLEAVLNTIVDGAIIIDAEGKVLFVNLACVGIFGYLQEELVGDNVRKLMPEPDRANHDSYIFNYVRTGAAQIIGKGREVEGRRKTGDVFPMDLAVGELKINGQQLFVGITRDLTNRRARRREFDELQARHFHLSRVSAMNEMGAAIAHEINQPLSANANFTETAKMLLESDVPDLAAACAVLDKALEQNNRASEIISRMRKFIEQGDVTSQVIDFISLLDDALMLGMSNFRQLGIQVFKQIDGTVNIKADPIQVQQVLVNLIRNACEAMENVDDRRLGIIVNTRNDDPKFMTVKITDTGPGLHSDVIPDLFKAFTTTKPNGMGVGLSISRSIIRAHGGRIWASNRVEGGAEFGFTLPLPDHAETQT